MTVAQPYFNLNLYRAEAPVTFEGSELHSLTYFRMRVTQSDTHSKWDKLHLDISTTVVYTGVSL
jgi:hypothetical protein